VVGPSATELESFNELIQFDHIYYKPQPEDRKVPKSVAAHVKSISGLENAIEKRLFAQVKSASEDENSPLKNVRVIITSNVLKGSESETIRLNTIKDVLQISDDVLNKNPEINTVSSSEEDVEGLTDASEIVLSSDADHSALLDLNFDLLDDLESILKADSEGLSCPGNNDLPSQIDELIDYTNNVKPITSSRGQKRKASSLEVEAIVDSLTKDMPSPLCSSDSDSMSDVAGSPYSSQGIGSPLQDNVLISSGEPESPLKDTMWEESFTELFPDLLYMLIKNFQNPDKLHSLI
jgi:hypothetical protein